MDRHFGYGWKVNGHGGTHAIDAAVASGVAHLFTLSGAHVFPLYDAAVGGKESVLAADSVRAAERDGLLRLIDVRHEQTAVFAAEAMGKLSRTPGFAALTAGPGVTNGISAITGAYFNGSPLVVLGGRAPDTRWGSGALQELDQPPMVANVTKRAFTIHDPSLIRANVQEAFDLAREPHRGPVFVDIPMDILFSWADVPAPKSTTWQQVAPDPDLIMQAATQVSKSRHPVVIIGGDIWQGDAVEQAQEFIRGLGLPAIANGMGRGILPPADPHLVTRARSHAFAHCDLVIVIGTPLDFRLGYGSFGDPPAAVLHLVDAVSQVSSHAPSALTIVGDLGLSMDAIKSAVPPTDFAAWCTQLRDLSRAAIAKDDDLFTNNSSPIHPARIYGDLLPRLTPDSVVIGDGGDFVSFAGKFVEPTQPGRWLDPGPYGCLGTGPGYAMAARLANPSSPTFLLMGDGAAGFSIMDMESLVRHQLPVAIIIGNNQGWALEKQPMRFLYGYDVIADLPAARYDTIMQALGGDGELVTEAQGIGPALDRAMNSKLPYVVNIMTDPEASYPRSTTGI